MIPHYISEENIPFLSGAGQDYLAMNEVLYSDRNNGLGEWLISKNKKACAWMRSDGNFTIYVVNDPNKSITVPGGLVPPSQRSVIFDFVTFTNQPEIVRQDTVTTLTLKPTGLFIDNFKGGNWPVVNIPPVPGVLKLTLLDSGDLVITRNGQAIWSLLGQTQTQGQAPAAQGFSINSLLLPAALGIGALLFLKK